MVLSTITRSEQIGYLQVLNAESCAHSCATLSTKGDVCNMRVRLGKHFSCQKYIYRVREINWDKIQKFITFLLKGFLLIFGENKVKFIVNDIQNFIFVYS